MYVPRTLAEVENEHIRATIAHCKGNMSEAAKVLNIHRRTLHRRVQRDGLLDELRASRELVRAAG